MHFLKNDLGNTNYPLTPGHELAGVVTAVGANVTKLAVGDPVGVGCMVDVGPGRWKVLATSPNAFHPLYLELNGFLLMTWRAIFVKPITRQVIDTHFESPCLEIDGIL